MLKSHKRHSAATKHAGGLPILQISTRSGTLYVTGFGDDVDTQLTRLTVLTGDGRKHAGTITLGHLNRLGNANHATPAQGWTMDHADAFPRSSS